MALVRGERQVLSPELGGDPSSYFLVTVEPKVVFLPGDLAASTPVAVAMTTDTPESRFASRFQILKVLGSRCDSQVGPSVV